MGNSKHTPGPWTVRPDPPNLESLIHSDAGGGVWIARVMFGIGTPDQRDANAALMASAPDLLSACEEALGLIEFFHGKPGWQEYQQSPEMKRLRAAISKAGATP